MINLAKDAMSLVYYAAMRFSISREEKGLTLVYHSLGGLTQPDPYKSSVPPDLFKREIEFLSLYRKDAVLTFDDGFSNFFDIALPLILKYNIKTVLFITSGFIDGRITAGDIFDEGFEIEPLDWKRIKEISALGIEIGSHALSHRNLAQIEEEAARREISDSKKRIEDVLGESVKSFAYPVGAKNAFNPRIKDMVKASGYDKAYTNIMGFNTAKSDPYELRRIRIYSDDNMFRFKLKINGAYNWID